MTQQFLFGAICAALVLVTSAEFTPLEAQPTDNDPPAPSNSNHYRPVNQAPLDINFILENLFSSLLNTDDRQFIEMFFNQLSRSDPRVAAILGRILAIDDPDAQMKALVTLSLRLLSEPKNTPARYSEGGMDEASGMKRFGGMPRLWKKAMPDFNPTGW